MAADASDRPRPSVWRAVGGAVAVAALWALLAALRPTVTFHLAPALVVWAGPYLMAGHPSRALVATSSSTGIALVSTLLLSSAGLLRGPVIVGGDALGESLIAIGAAVVLAVLAIALQATNKNPP